MYPTNDTTENRRKQQDLGYQDGINGRARGASDVLGKTSGALKGEYDRAYDVGYSRYREANPEPIAPKDPVSFEDYAFPLIADTSNMPFDTQVILRSHESEHLAIGIRYEGSPDEVDIILGFSEYGYGLSTPIEDIVGWYPVLKQHLPESTYVREQAAQRERLRDNRLEIAQRAYEDYEFLEGFSVTDSSGWEFDNDARELTRTIYIEFAPEEDGDDTEETSSISCTFTVRFEANSEVVTDIDAYDPSGNSIGNLPQLVQDRLAAARDAARSYRYGLEITDLGEWTLPFGSSHAETTVHLKEDSGNFKEVPRRAKIRVIFDPDAATIASIQAYDLAGSPIGNPTTPVA